MLTRSIFNEFVALSRNCLHRSFSAQTAAACSSSNFGSNTELYGPDHVQLQETVAKIVEKDINPFVDAWEAAESFPSHDLFKKLGNAGIFGVTKPVEYGGLGLDLSYSMAVAESLGACNCGGVPMAIGVQSDMATPALAMFGSDELRKEFLVPAIAGDVVACIGVSEPSGGSDVGSVQTHAVQSGDDLVINGSKMWITNGMEADWVCLLANTERERGPYKNKSLIMVPLNQKGVKRSKISKLGNFSSDTAILYFDDVRVPSKNIIGTPGDGFLYQMLQFQIERMWAVAAMLPTLERMIQETIQYTTDRYAFGQPLLNNQVIHFRLAELQTEVEALRALLYRAIAQYQSGSDVTKLASMAKLKVGRLAREVADSCLQYWGGMGYANETFISRAFRDVRLISIGGGADEVMLSIICKYMDTLPKLPKNLKKG